MAMALVPAVLTLNVSPCSFSVAVDNWRLALSICMRVDELATCAK